MVLFGSQVARFPGYLSKFLDIKFADVPNGLAAFSKVAWVGDGGRQYVAPDKGYLTKKFTPKETFRINIINELLNSVFLGSFLGFHGLGQRRYLTVSRDVHYPVLEIAHLGIV